MKEEILEFIHRRFPNEDNWLTGNCYWFAYILTARFYPYLQIYVFPIQNHFVVKDPDGRFYDWSGEVFPKETPLTHAEAYGYDIEWANRLKRDCID